MGLNGGRTNFSVIRRRMIPKRACNVPPCYRTNFLRSFIYCYVTETAYRKQVSGNQPYDYTGSGQPVVEFPLNTDRPTRKLQRRTRFKSIGISSRSKETHYMHSDDSIDVKCEKNVNHDDKPTKLTRNQT